MPNTLTPHPTVQKQPVVVTQQQPTEQLPASPPPVDTSPLIITRFQFRKLFTMAERMAIDNAQYNVKFSGTIKAAIFTMQKDMEVSATVDLHLPDVIQGVNYLAMVGILTQARARRILSNQVPL